MKNTSVAKYIGPLFLPYNRQVFTLKEDWQTDGVEIRGIPSYCMSDHKVEEVEAYGLKLFQPGAHNNAYTDCVWTIPAGNKFTLVKKTDEYQLHFTKKLNPNGVYNIIVVAQTFNIPIVEEN